MSHTAERPGDRVDIVYRTAASKDSMAGIGPLGGIARLTL
jgi:hypothetical protein